jgi:hypothetical protein
MVATYDVEDLFDDADDMSRTVLAFFSGARIFYCARERRLRVHGGGDGALFNLI